MTDELHELLSVPLGERCGGWWKGGPTATGVRVNHECDLQLGHAGPCTCSCGAHQLPVREPDDDDGDEL